MTKVYSELGRPTSAFLSLLPKLSVHGTLILAEAA